VPDGGKGAALAGAPHLHDFFKQVHRFVPQFTLRRARPGVNRHAADPRSSRVADQV
jgi:hypothetical protein